VDLGKITTRDDAIELLEGYSFDRKADLDANRTRHPLIKSYLLEDPSCANDRDFPSIFREAGHEVFRIDETLFKVRDRTTKEYVGFIERVLPRYPVIYTNDDTRSMDPWVRRLVAFSSRLDHLWISGHAFERLLDWNFEHKPLHRYGRLVFQHSSVFESESPVDRLVPESDAESADDPDEYVPERRTTRFTMVDRLSVLREKLQPMRDIYSPLHVIAQLRFPATGSGGHDFYFNGKATNRSASFADHRAHVRFVLETYRNAIQKTETDTWRQEETAFNVTGAPVRLRFREPLSQDTFDTFIDATFRRKQNRFGLWGDPIRLGSAKVHVYALDRHLWQQLFVEITREQMLVIIPRGTCGNSIHRLVTNVQQYLDPAVDVHIGEQPYRDFINVPAGATP
jgi:hypothetical protein